MSRRKRSVPVTVSAALAVVGLGGCSLGVSDSSACTESAACVAAFGFGSTCTADGYCSEPVSNARCTKTFPTDLFVNHGDYDDLILIGSMFSYQDHNASLQSAELAVRQVNVRQGLDGVRYGIVHCDYAGDLEDGLSDIEASEQTAAYLANTLQVPAIVGPRGSSRTAAAFTAIREQQVVVMSPSATSPELTGIDVTLTPTDQQPGFLWRTVPPDTLQSKVIAQDMLTRNVTSVAVLYQVGPYGEGLMDLFRSEFLDPNDPDIRTMQQIPFSEPGIIDEQIPLIATDISAGIYDEVLFVSSDIDDVKRFLIAASATPQLEATYASVGLFLLDAAFDDQLFDDPNVQSATQLLSNVRGTRPAPAEGPVYDSFVASYTIEYGEEVTSAAYAPHSYDAAWLVMFSTAWSMFQEQAVTGMGTARGLRQLSSGDRIAAQGSGWTSAVEQFRRGMSIDVEGASGHLDYNRDTEETTAPISLWHIVCQDGECAFEELDRIDPM